MTLASRLIKLSCACLTVAASAQSIQIPPGQHVVLKAEGRGVQIYNCEQKDAVAKWVFVAPEAKLYVNGVQTGTHAAGPVWNYRDGSSVHGKVETTVPSPNASDIPSLLLKATETSGNGLFTQVSYIERSQTKGGVRNEKVCDAAHIGSSSRVPYSATYTFYAPEK
jgi:hypothetical protein